MEYKPGGYSWLGVAPESSVEEELEKLEDQIRNLQKEYTHNQDLNIAKAIKTLEEKLEALRKKN